MNDQMNEKKNILARYARYTLHQPCTNFVKSESLKKYNNNISHKGVTQGPCIIIKALKG